MLLRRKFFPVNFRKQKTDVIIHGHFSKFPSFCFPPKVTSRFRITTNDDQGFSTIHNFHPKKMTNQKTAGTKSLLLPYYYLVCFFCPSKFGIPLRS